MSRLIPSTTALTRLVVQQSGLQAMGSSIVAIVALYGVYRTVLAVYRIYLHPLARFPGPRDAALSNNWTLAQSKAGHPEEVFEKLHEKYGAAAIRIGPNELHISDVSKYKVIYSQTTPYLKNAEFYAAFGTPHTLFVEDDPVLHKERRRILNPFFSRSGILKMEPLFVEKIKNLLARLEDLRQVQSINIYNAFRCVTADVISDYAFGRSLDLTQTTDKNFHGGFLIAFDAVAGVLWDMAYRVTLRKATSMIPKAVARRVSPELEALFGLADESKKSLENYRTGMRGLDKARPVVFDGLEGLADDHQVAEAVDILTAGSDTTAFSLSMGLWYIIRDPQIKNTLVAALLEGIPDVNHFPSLLKLEEIPYLVACVRESIRVAKAVPGRLPRVVPKNGPPLVVDGKVIPPGTIVGMSAYTMHNSEELWGPDARSFNPDRWLGEKGKSLDQYMVSFSKGIRSCIGQNLAFAEATLVMAYLLRNYDIKPREGSEVLKWSDNFTNTLNDPGFLVDLTPR